MPRKSLSSMESLLPWTKVSSKPRRNVESILFGAFLIFSVGVFIFVSYIAVEHYYERQTLEAEIDKMNTRLESLASISKQNPALNKMVAGMIAAERRCDCTHSLIEHIGKRVDHENTAPLEMWDKIPMAFLHLTGRNLTVGVGAGNVGGMKSVSGWQTQVGEGCPDTNPRTDGTDIIIPRDGNYSVHSQITFYSGGETAIHRHVVQYVERFGGIEDDPKILMENAYQIGDGEMKVSHQSGVYRFNKHDSLRVVVKKPSDTSFHKDATGSGVEASFEVLLL